MKAIIEAAAARIVEGEKWNGVVYAKASGKSFTSIFIYINNEMVRFACVDNSVKDQVIAEIKNGLGVKSEANQGRRNEWVINGKRVYNNLSYGEMFKKYGTNFE